MCTAAARFWEEFCYFALWTIIWVRNIEVGFRHVQSLQRHLFFSKGKEKNWHTQIAQYHRPHPSFIISDPCLSILLFIEYTRSFFCSDLAIRRVWDRCGLRIVQAWVPQGWWLLFDSAIVYLSHLKMSFFLYACRVLRRQTPEKRWKRRIDLIAVIWWHRGALWERGVFPFISFSFLLFMVGFILLPPLSKLKSVNWAESMHIDIKQSEICGLHYLTRFFFPKRQKHKRLPRFIKRKKEKQAQNES